MGQETVGNDREVVGGSCDSQGVGNFEVFRSPLGVVPTRLSSYEACALVGCSYRQITYWMSTGLVTLRESAPIGWSREKPGSGGKHRFDAAEVIRVCVIHRLVSAGISLTAVRRILPTASVKRGDYGLAFVDVDLSAYAMLTVTLPRQLDPMVDEVVGLAA